MTNHDASVGAMLDSDDEAAIGLLGRDPEVQFVRLASAFNAKKTAIRDAINMLCDGQQGTERTLEALKILRAANAEAHGRAVARTVQPLVGSLDGDK